MKKIATAFCFLLIFNAFAQNLNHGKVKADYYAEIPFKWIKGKIIIPVEINNKTYSFLLDTGAPNIISKKIAKSIQAKHLKSIVVKDATGKKDSMNIVEIPLLKLGEISFENTASLQQDSTNNLIFDCLEIDGLIGSNMLRNSIIQFDLKRKLIILTDSKKKVNLSKKNASKLQLIGNQKLPIFWMKFKQDRKVKLALEFDSGSSNFIDICNRNYHELKKQHVFKNTNVKTANGSNTISLFGLGDKKELFQFTIPKGKINNFTFKNALVSSNGGSLSKIGTKLLQYGVVTIDFIHKKFYFNPSKKEVDLHEKTFGFNFTVKDNQLIIGTVWNANLKPKIAYGNKVLSINGIDYTNKDICELMLGKSILEQENKLQITFINKDNKKTTLFIEKQ